MDTTLASYKGERSAVIQALQDTQRAEGYISQERLKFISQHVGVPYSYVYAIATFYKSFSLTERGKFILKVCDGTACHLQSSEDLIDEIQQYLGIGVGETTDDRLFSLEQVNCLGACTMAPVVAVNDTLHGNLSRKKLRTLLDSLSETNGQKQEGS
ncbi:NAD(P)H-dependent oxidoreductase subunit E [candidate division KSB3 bacterium]|uniref:NAD(P)H-dependent oxidoreductase subunit E n=1 Tax=candidate division KSB3 bacterium TaxID=2044937 RepID=A0A2G6K9P6_9BACT|nr:MAG: NAD(P)H-dependent oxidoreductase subunit E [candidate division KSB3 bacterium]